MSPLTALSWTCCGVLAIALFSETVSLAFFAAICLCVQGMSYRSAKYLGRFIVLTAPISLMLLAVHGSVLPFYDVQLRLMDLVPIRPAGLLHAAYLSALLAVVTAVALCWPLVSRDESLDALTRIRAPIALIVITLQSLALLDLIKHRVDAVFDAQRARGIPVSSRFYRRILSLPSVFLPVITTTLYESDIRARLMTSRGLGAIEVIWSPSHKLERSEVFAISIAPTALLLAWSISFVGDRSQ